MVKVEGLDRLKRKLAAMPKVAKERLGKAVDKNASEFEATVRRIVPRDTSTPDGKHLVDSLTNAKVGEIAREVSIGGPGLPYPLHLEAGHRARDGSHVEGKPFWNPAKRVLRKRGKRRLATAMREAVKAAAKGAT